MTMTRLLFYRRLASPLHATRAGVGALWALALTAAAGLLQHPVVLAVLALALLGAGVGAGVGRGLARSLLTALVVAVPIVAINVLVSRQGLTVFARLGDLGPFGQGNLTVEALVYGAVIALKVTILIVVSTLASLTVDPDEMLRIFRGFSFRSALTASLATRMVPVLAADAQRLAEAQRTRPEGAPRGTRARLALVGAVLSGSLDRAMDVAATLEVRGFAAASTTTSKSSCSSGRRRLRRSARRLRQPWSRHDVAFACSAAAVLVLALVGRLAGPASFRAYPLVGMRWDWSTLALCAALAAAILLPFGDRRGIDP
jgi:energy-coupling factor transport system permease protein